MNENTSAPYYKKIDVDDIVRLSCARNWSQTRQAYSPDKFVPHVRGAFNLSTAPNVTPVMYEMRRKS